MVTAECLLDATQSKSMPQIKKALSDIGWKIEEDSKDLIKVSAPSSIFSWGEMVEIKLSPQVGKTHVLITSEPKWQIIDFGKSEENVGVLRAKILERVKGE